MTDDERQISEAIAEAFKTLSDRLSNELGAHSIKWPN
jgi:hypothetical protein